MRQEEEKKPRLNAIEGLQMYLVRVFIIGIVAAG